MSRGALRITRGSWRRRGAIKDMVQGVLSQREKRWDAIEKVTYHEKQQMKDEKGRRERDSCEGRKQ